MKLIRCRRLALELAFAILASWFVYWAREGDGVVDALTSGAAVAWMRLMWYAAPSWADMDGGGPQRLGG